MPKPPESEAKTLEYQAAMLDVVKRARLAALGQALSGTELKDTSRAWTEILMGIVPLERLNECYLTAMRNRNSTFPLNASELCTAWREMQAIERFAPKPQVADCEICRGTGWEQMENRAVRPCKCRQSKTA
ncbi:MAG: hypothetical protein K1Y36_30660 [Blastocatellia bacterium]|nr:hypothetical protein [Blastocatellia bacterium]